MAMNRSNILSRDCIIERAKNKWNTKCREVRLMCGKKYRHIFDNLKLKTSPWENDFDHLEQSQKNILIKGELIRTYDNLPNSDKTTLKHFLGLEKFSGKWYKLTPSDKKILLNFILNQ